MEQDAPDLARSLQARVRLDDDVLRTGHGVSDTDAEAPAVAPWGPRQALAPARGAWCRAGSARARQAIASGAGSGHLGDDRPRCRLMHRPGSIIQCRPCPGGVNRLPPRSVARCRTGPGRDPPSRPVRAYRAAARRRPRARRHRSHLWPGARAASLARSRCPRSGCPPCRRRDSPYSATRAPSIMRLVPADQGRSGPPGASCLRVSRVSPSRRRRPWRPLCTSSRLLEAE